MALQRKFWVFGVAAVSLLTLALSGCGTLRSLNEQAAAPETNISDRVALLEQEVADLQVALNQVQQTGASAQAGAEGAGDQTASGEQPSGEGQAVNADQGAMAVVAGTPGYLNVRQEPDINSTQVGALVEGTEVSILQVQDNWTQIQYRDTLTGWVSSDYLQRKD